MAVNVARYFRPDAVAGLEALHADFAAHAYRPHSHPTWTVAVVERGAAKFDLEDTRQRADHGDLFVLEPGAVHTGTGAVPEGWAYKVLYLEPELIGAYADGDGPVAQTARWVVFRDRALRRSLLHVHAALADAGAETLALEEACLFALDGLSRHLRPLPAPRRRGRPEHAAVRRARRHLETHWSRTVALRELAEVSRLSRFELVRRFHAQVGLTPHAFQRDLRIAHARELLRGGESPATVAAACGFADQPHLTRVFREAVGVTPARFARAR